MVAGFVLGKFAAVYIIYVRTMRDGDAS